MRRTHAILALMAASIVSSCVPAADTDNLQSQIDELNTITIESLKGQIATISSSLAVLQTAQNSVSEYIASLQSSVGSLNGNYDALKESAEAIEAKADQLDKDLKDLKAFVDSQSSDLKKWVAEYYLSLEKFSEVEKDITGIKESISSLESTLEAFDSTTKKIAQDLEDATGKVTGKLTECQTEIEGIKKALSSLEGRTDKLEESMAKLISSVQSVVVVPDYTDGSVKVSDVVDNHFYFEVYPQSAVENLAALGAGCVSLDAVETMTKSGAREQIGLKVSSVTKEDRYLVVTADGSALSDDFKSGVKTASARLLISDGTVTRSSEYFPLSYDIEENVFRTGEAVNVTASECDLEGIINPEMAGDVTTFGIQYTATDFTRCNELYPETVDGDGRFVCHVEYLKSGTTYYYRTFISRGGERIYGKIRTFESEAIEVEFKDEVTESSTHKVKVQATIDIAPDYLNPREVELIYSREFSDLENLLEKGKRVHAWGSIANVWESNLNGLISNTTWNYVIAVSVYDKTFYSEIGTFSTDREECELVDLGLSVKWASRNIGADAAEDRGFAFPWGYIESDYLRWNYEYKWWDEESGTYTKYANPFWFFDQILLEPEDDVATVTFGEGYFIPTAAQWRELMDFCSGEYVEIGGTYGYLITSNVYGYSDKSIFLPGNPTEYWSSDLDVYNDNCALKGDGTSDYRYNSRMIRPVYGKKAVTPPDGSGTLADPFSTKQACNLVSRLGTNEKIYGVYTHGYVSSITELSEAYGNATYTITDEDHIYSLKVYRGRGLGNTNISQDNSISVGDEVVVYGDLGNFYGSPEYFANNYIAVLNGNQ